MRQLNRTRSSPLTGRPLRITSLGGIPKHRHDKQQENRGEREFVFKESLHRIKAPFLWAFRPSW
jgi:hypothetical protein